jgi:hypothetical protein
VVTTSSHEAPRVTFGRERVEAPLEIVDLLQRDCVVAHVSCSYDQITEAHDRINARIAADGLALTTDETIAGKGFNRYLTTPDRVPEAELVTEVFEVIA